ncbi:hypothetical protein LOZ53_006070 [Ophidiomyces ophidiicola]|uniref:Uncharacterized protein n=1 Tax=Ophidiomyces ophidiicola TaxID=1387563 RepID=A0ACB8UW94_9EURO|nr:uncharacterized protein LOZ57_002040 [Ophidiomyces ophidiicola]KAI1914545.1 hypothetical protein LOZ61_002214 [Ophidiomyces ophidiicola]KAI1915508.1 hypothetical protein LOZ64_003537 [Ophidiomyces ophidiicola]KAI1927503.1 hypothetical protein LOZ60_003088 [Ophidiomyces ophidiicola]KAI1950481.1 hypothetical protein LOZ57_002040 [Ophidiomyces ophidiicola]KAI1951451.1 hypothetical protein LOZ62_001694 [Ophidiomyces ophidiicola]
MSVATHPLGRRSRADANMSRYPRGLRINEDVVVHLKWGQTEYKGQLISVDSYMNLQLSNTEEFIDGKNTGTLGQVLIRCVLLALKRPFSFV